jgi:outer membrane protein TolC
VAISSRVPVGARLQREPNGSSRAAVVPVDVPRCEEPGVSLDEAMALKNRPELAQRRIDIERTSLDLRTARADRLPTLDVGLTAARQIRAAARFRELATRALDVEQRKFQDGTSNNFMIGQRQADLAQAQLAELGAVIRYRKARTALEAAMGTLIEARGVRLDSAAQFPDRRRWW